MFLLFNTILFVDVTGKRVESDENMIMNGEYTNTWKEAVVTYSAFTWKAEDNNYYSCSDKTQDTIRSGTAVAQAV
jgi:hypothetical protein